MFSENDSMIILWEWYYHHSLKMIPWSFSENDSIIIFFKWFDYYSLKMIPWSFSLNNFIIVPKERFNIIIPKGNDLTSLFPKRTIQHHHSLGNDSTISFLKETIPIIILREWFYDYSLWTILISFFENDSMIILWKWCHYHFSGIIL